MWSRDWGFSYVRYYYIDMGMWRGEWVEGRGDGHFNPNPTEKERRGFSPIRFKWCIAFFCFLLKSWIVEIEWCCGSEKGKRGEGRLPVFPFSTYIFYIARDLQRHPLCLSPHFPPSSLPPFQTSTRDVSQLSRMMQDAKVARWREREKGASVGACWRGGGNMGTVWY